MRSEFSLFILTKSVLFVQLSHSLQDGPNVPQYFRLNQLEEECEFVSQKEFAESKRFKLIQLRDKGVRWCTYARKTLLSIFYHSL